MKSKLIIATHSLTKAIIGTLLLALGSGCAAPTMQAPVTATPQASALEYNDTPDGIAFNACASHAGSAGVTAHENPYSDDAIECVTDAYPMCVADGGVLLTHSGDAFCVYVMTWDQATDMAL